MDSFDSGADLLRLSGGLGLFSVAQSYLQATSTAEQPDPSSPSASSASLSHSPMLWEAPDLKTLTITGVPGKSRVEKQIKMKLGLRDLTGEPCVDWQYVEVGPPAEQAEEEAPGRALRLLIDTLCAPEPHLAGTCSLDTLPKAQRCSACGRREQRAATKRSQKRRRKSENIAAPDSNSLPADGIIAYHNKQRYLPLKAGQCTVSIRVTCYCRHNNAPSGFVLRLRLMDGAHEVASCCVGPIMIKDDHKQRDHSEVNHNARTALTLAGLFDEEACSRLGSPADVKPLTFPGMPSLLPPISADGAPAPSFGVPKEIPALAKVIPSSSPCSGGVEVSVLGRGFYPGIVICFGGISAARTECWSSETIVCMAPPAPAPGSVPVTIFGQPVTDMSGTSPIFTYTNEDEKELMELALLLIGQKLGGAADSARSVAMSILHGGPSNGSSDASSSASSSSTSSPTSSPASTNTYQSAQSPQRGIPMDKLQALVCELVSRLAQEVDLSLPNDRGIALLHVAASMGHLPLINTIIAMQPEAALHPDHCGLLPLHHAAIRGHPRAYDALLAAGGRNARCLRGHTALYYLELSCPGYSTRVPTECAVDLEPHAGALSYPTYSDPEFSDTEPSDKETATTATISSSSSSSSSKLPHNLPHNLVVAAEDPMETARSPTTSLMVQQQRAQHNTTAAPRARDKLSARARSSHQERGLHDEYVWMLPDVVNSHEDHEDVTVILAGIGRPTGSPQVLLDSPRGLQNASQQGHALMGLSDDEEDEQQAMQDWNEPHRKHVSLLGCLTKVVKPIATGTQRCCHSASSSKLHARADMLLPCPCKMSPSLRRLLVILVVVLTAALLVVLPIVLRDPVPQAMPLSSGPVSTVAVITSSASPAGMSAPLWLLRGISSFLLSTVAAVAAFTLRPFRPSAPYLALLTITIVGNTVIWTA